MQQPISFLLCLVKTYPLIPILYNTTHIPQFRERKNRFGKRQGQADGEYVDEEAVVPGLGFAIVIRCACGEGQSPQSTERSSAWLGDQSAC